MVANNSDFYQIGASLSFDAPSYVQRQADDKFYKKLKEGKFCYVLNSRQMGKSSLRVRTMQRLEAEGTVCAAIDLTGIGKHKVTISQWYGGIVYALVESCQLEEKFDFDWQIWWQEHQKVLDPVRCLSLFIEQVLLKKIQQPIVIFVDEIDRVLSQDFSLDDFFALIRFFQNQRVDKPIFERLTFALLGVATPSDLITDKTQTPFNIGEEIELHGFQLEEIQPLIKGLQGRFDNPRRVIEEILDWTGGQPFLTQKLCKLMVDESFKDNPCSVTELVRAKIIDNWESQDNPEHLRTIRNRICSDDQRASYLLELYQQVRQSGELATNNSIEVSELQLSGLVVKRQDKLRVYNKIYREIFDFNWIENQLNNLRPYSENFRFWVASGGVDESRLLRGKALQEADEWVRDKNLSYQDKEFLAASKKKEIQEEIAAQEQEAALSRERKDREAAEERTQLLSQANRKAQRRISIGIVVLVIAVLGAIALGLFSSRQVEVANKAEGELKQAKEQTQDAQRSAEQANRQESEAQKKIEDANKIAKEAQQQANNYKESVSKFEQDAAKARQNLNTAQGDLETKSKELSKTNDQLIQSQNQESEILAKLKTKETELNLTSAKNDETKTEVTNVRQLVELAGKLRNESPSASDEALRLAALSFNIDNHQLKQALLFSTKSQAYQKLKDWINAKNEIQESQLSLSKADKNELVSNQGLQIQVLFQKSQGDLLVQDKQSPKAIESLRVAFNILRVHPTETDFTKDNQLLTGKNVELVHRDLIKLISQKVTELKLMREVEISLTKHLYAQLEYFLKAKNWKSADRETSKLMLNIAKRDEQGDLDYDNINNFSCPDLQKIDHLWVNADNRFGFSVQKEIWIKTGNRLGIKPETFTSNDYKNYIQFVKAVEWYDEKGTGYNQAPDNRGSYVQSDELYNRIKKNSVGYRGSLPAWHFLPADTERHRAIFFSFLATCKV